MPEDQKTLRLKEMVREKAGLFLSYESNRQSLITVTNVILSSDSKLATILVTVLPEHKEAAAIDFLKRKRGEFRTFLMKETRAGRIPRIDFAIDLGEKNRQRIDEISQIK